MTVLEVKKLLLEKGLNISDMARKLAEENNGNFDSMRTMLTDLLYGRRYFPSLAVQVEEMFGITISRAPHQLSVRDSIKQVA